MQVNENFILAKNFQVKYTFDGAQFTTVVSNHLNYCNLFQLDGGISIVPAVLLVTTLFQSSVNVFMKAGDHNLNVETQYCLTATGVYGTDFDCTLYSSVGNLTK